MSDDTRNNAEAGDDATTIQARSIRNDGIMNLGGNNTFNGRTIVNGRVISDDEQDD